MDAAREMELDTPDLELKEPWYGYPLSAWTRENEDEAERAISGRYFEAVKNSPRSGKPRSRRLMITVGIVSPWWLDPEALRAACGAWVCWYKYCYSGSNFLREGQFAGNDETRAEALLVCKDERVDAILCTRGGFGSTRILEYIFV